MLESLVEHQLKPTFGLGPCGFSSGQNTGETPGEDLPVEPVVLSQEDPLMVWGIWELRRKSHVHETWTHMLRLSE